MIDWNNTEISQLHYTGDTRNMIIYFHRLGIGSEESEIANVTNSLAVMGDNNGAEPIYVSAAILNVPLTQEEDI